MPIVRERRCVSPLVLTAALALALVLALVSADLDPNPRAGTCPEFDPTDDCPEFTQFCEVDDNCTDTTMKCCDDPCFAGDPVCLTAVPT